MKTTTKNRKHIVSFEVVEIWGNDMYVKCSLNAALSDENIYSNIWSTLVDQIAYFRKILFWSSFFEKKKKKKKNQKKSTFSQHKNHHPYPVIRCLEPSGTKYSVHRVITASSKNFPNSIFSFLQFFGHFMTILRAIFGILLNFVIFREKIGFGKFLELAVMTLWTQYLVPEGFMHPITG